MEPITTVGFMWTLIEGVAGNRADFFVTKGFKNLYDRIANRLNEPANLIIQKAIRKSYLQATSMMVNHLLKSYEAHQYANEDKWQLKTILNFLREEIENTKKEDKYIPVSLLDAEYREILFPKKESSQKRIVELTSGLKSTIIHELKDTNIALPEKLKCVINNGWKENNKHYDLFELTAAFFTKELNDNPQLSTYIQVEYLDHLAFDSKELQVEFAGLKAQLNQHFENYKTVLPKLDEIIKGQEEIKEVITDLNSEVIRKLDEAIEQKHIASIRQITISEEYQVKIKRIESLIIEIKSVRTQISNLENLLSKEPKSIDELQPTINSLNKQLFEKFSEKEKQENALNIFITDVINLAKKLNEVNDYNSSRLEKARALFKEGKFIEINELLNEEEIDKDIAASKERIEIRANELTIKAQIIVVKKEEGWFKEADRLYAKAMQAVENYHTTFDYAHFLAEHEQILKAQDIYQKNLNYVSDEDEKASTLNNLALLQKKNNEFDKAEKGFNEVLKIRRRSSQINQQKYLPEVANTLCNIAVLLDNKDEFEKAEKSYIEALNIYRGLAEVNLPNYLLCLANILNNLGSLYHKTNEIKQADQSFQEALEIKRKLAEANPRAYLPDLASTLNNLAILRRSNNEFDKAEQYHKEALEIYQKLAQDNPQTYLPFVATCLLNLGNLNYRLIELEEAEANYQEALRIWQKLAINNPQRHLSDLASTLNNLAALSYKKNDFAEAKKRFNEALKLRRKLAEVNPQVYLPQVADTLNNLGALLLDNNEFEKSEKILRESIKIKRELIKVNPQTYLPNLAESLHNMGNLQKNKKKFGKAEKAYNEALKIRRKLAEDNPQTYLLPLADSLNGFANLKLDKNEFDEAAKLYQEVLKIKRKLAKDNPKVYLSSVTDSLNNLAVLHKEKNEFDKADDLFEESLKIKRELAKANPQKYLLLVADTLNNYANLKRDKNELDKAEKFYKEALAISQQFVKDFPQTFFSILVMTQINMAVFYQKYKNNKKKSLKLVNETIDYILPQPLTPAIQSYLDGAFYVIHHWGMDVEEYWKEKTTAK